jgi:formylglycine-generating enzyme
VTVLAGACGAFDAELGSEDEDAGATVIIDGGAASPDALLDASNEDRGPCPSRAGSPMVLVAPQGLPAFCIDATEVTRAQYKEFVDDAPGPEVSGSQIPYCAENLRYVSSGTDLDGGDLPVSDVDWCDAHAFCAWAGKRLCGALGGGGPLPTASTTSPTESEWMAACSRAGTRSYPYGQSFVDGGCNGGEGAPHPVGSLASCEGGYDGLFDMAGNLAEWENACNGAPFQDGGRCAVRGGNFQMVDPKCSNDATYLATNTSNRFGIRCCATPRPLAGGDGG